MKTILLLLILSFPFTALAQDSTFSKTDQIRFKPFIGYVQNGHRLSEKKLKTELYKTPAAIPYHKKYHNRKVIGYSLLAPTVAFALLGRTNQNVNSPRYGNDRSGFSAAGFATGLTSVFFIFSSFRQLKIGVRRYNRAVY